VGYQSPVDPELVGWDDEGLGWSPNRELGDEPQNLDTFAYPAVDFAILHINVLDRPTCKKVNLLHLQMPPQNASLPLSEIESVPAIV